MVSPSASEIAREREAERACEEPETRDEDSPADQEELVVRPVPTPTLSPTERTTGSGDGRNKGSFSGGGVIVCDAPALSKTEELEPPASL